MTPTEAISHRSDEALNAELLQQDPDLKAELDIFAITDPRVMALKVLRIPGYTVAERRLLEDAVDETFEIYADKRRKYSPTFAILHALGLAIPTPSEGTPPIEVTIGRLLHDIPEDFMGYNPSSFNKYGAGTVTFIDAMTKRPDEPYNEYIMRLAQISSKHPHLLIASSKGRDMRRNCLDPYGLPSIITRSSNTQDKMPETLQKYADHYPLLSMYGNTNIPNVGNAVILGKRANDHPQLIVAR